MGWLMMSEKKFRLSSETVLQYQIMNNDPDLNENEVVDLLNKLYEENEQLKKEYKIAIDEMITDYKKLEEENEQLREALKNSYNWEICENCEYANYSSHYVYAEGIEYDFECLKGHAHVDEMSECDEFKLKIR